jgi:hypothetical protein
MMAEHLPHGLEVARLHDIRAAVARGKADVEAGHTLDAAEAFAELEAYFRAVARDHASVTAPVSRRGRT